jgi:hypothetical protein
MQFMRPTRPPLHLRPGPNARNGFAIFDWHYMRFLLRAFVFGRRHDERPRSTQREADDNDCEFQHPAHRRITVCSLSFSRNAALNDGDK